jgi:hypothetical protein
MRTCLHILWHFTELLSDFIIFTYFLTYLRNTTKQHSKPNRKTRHPNNYGEKKWRRPIRKTARSLIHQILNIDNKDNLT